MILIVLLINFSIVSNAIAGIQITHLQPEEGAFGYSVHNPYYSSVNERLLSSSWYRKCQAIFLPSFSPESAVYILYDYEKPNQKPIVVSVELEKHLWTEMQILIQEAAKPQRSYSTGPEAQKKVLPLIQISVNRSEAPIENKVFDILEQIWATILSQTHYPKKYNSGLDGERTHFANFTKGFGYQTGNTWSPNKDTTNYKVVELAKALQNYPNLLESERSEAANKLFYDAQNLLKLFNEKNYKKLISEPDAQH